MTGAIRIRRFVWATLVVTVVVLAVACSGVTDPTGTVEPAQPTVDIDPGNDPPTSTETPVSNPTPSSPTASPAPTPTVSPTPTPTAPPPTASFSADVRSGPAPLTVVFGSETDGQVDSYQWDFGDGSSGSGPAPDHRYTVAGDHTVKLTVSGANGSDTWVMPGFVTVVAGAVVSLGVEPPQGTVTVAQTLIFVAVGRDEFDNPVSLEATWSSTEEGGSINSEGEFTADTVSGTFSDTVLASVQAESGDLKASASVTVEPGPVDTVVIDPTELSVSVLEDQVFTFVASDEYGNNISDFVSSWDISGEAGTITSDGEFMSGTKAGVYPGGVSVTVVSGSGLASAKSDITISPDVLDRVIVSPSPIMVQWAASQDFSAVGADSFGNEIPGLEFIWEATGGGIDQSGLYTAARQVGDFSVSAGTTSGVKVTGQATINIPAPTFSILAEWGESISDGLLTHPWMVEVGPDGMVYVTDGDNYRVQKFTEDGQFVTTWGDRGSGPGQFADTPSGLGIDSSGKVYVGEPGDNPRISKFTADGQFITAWGGPGSGPGEFTNPTGIGISFDDSVYIADRDNHRVQKFDTDGNFLTEWGSFGDGVGQFNSPADVAVDSDGVVYVLEQNNHRVQKFTANGEFLGTWGSLGTGSGQFDTAYGIGVMPDDVIVVSDNKNGRIQKFTTDGGFIASWGVVGKSTGNFATPAGISVNPSGDIYVADWGNNRIQRFGRNGDFLTQWGGGSSGEAFRSATRVNVDSTGATFVTNASGGTITKLGFDGRFLLNWAPFDDDEITELQGIAVDSAGNVYVADLVSDRVKKFNNFGEYLSDLGEPKGSGNGQFFDPTGIAIDSEDNVFVADRGNHRIQKFSSAGIFLNGWGGLADENDVVGTFDEPTGIAIAPDGSVLVADYFKDRIQKFMNDGTFMSTWGSRGSGPGQFIQPSDIAVDSLGNVYVSDQENDRIQMFTADGTYITEWVSAGTDAGQIENPFGITVDFDNRVLVPSGRLGVIQIFVSPGTA